MDQEKTMQKLFKELGIDDLPEDKQLSLLQTMTESLLKRLTLNVLEKLSEGDRGEFEKIQEEEDAKKMEEFLRSKIDDYDKLVEDTTEEFKQEIKGYIDEMKAEFEK